MRGGVLAGSRFLLMLALSGSGAAGASLPQAGPPLVLHYRAEWRLMHAGDVTLRFHHEPGTNPTWRAELELKTRGFAAALYKVDNRYTVVFDSSFCAASYDYLVHERSKRRQIRVRYQDPAGKASYVEYDLVRDKVVETRTVDVPECVHDELAALARLRTMDVVPPASVELPVSNGKKAALARVEAQRRERIETPSGVYDAIRYEAFLFKNVLYRRNARLFVWLTDDEHRLPVQIRIQMPFFIGTVTLQLAGRQQEETT